VKTRSIEDMSTVKQSLARASALARRITQKRLDTVCARVRVCVDAFYRCPTPAQQPEHKVSTSFADDDAAAVAAPPPPLGACVD
jgi:hypothetical protein